MSRIAFFSPIQTNSHCRVNDWANAFLEGKFWQGKKVEVVNSINQPPSTKPSDSFWWTLWKICVLIPVGGLLRILAFALYSDVRASYWQTPSTLSTQPISTLPAKDNPPAQEPQQTGTSPTSPSTQPSGIEKTQSPTPAVQLPQLLLNKKETGPFNLEARQKTLKLLTERVPSEVLQKQGSELWKYLSDNSKGSCKYIWEKLKNPELFWDLFTVPCYTQLQEHLLSPENLTVLFQQGPEIAFLTKDLVVIPQIQSTFTSLAPQQQQQALSKKSNARAIAIAQYLQNAKKGPAKPDLVFEYTFTLMTLHQLKPITNYDKILTHLKSEFEDCIPDLNTFQNNLLRVGNKSVVHAYKMGKSFPELYLQYPDIPQQLPILQRSPTLLKSTTGTQYFQELASRLNETSGSKRAVPGLLGCVQNFQFFSFYKSEQNPGYMEILQKHEWACTDLQIQLLSGQESLAKMEGISFIRQCLDVYANVICAQLDESRLYEVLQFSKESLQDWVTNDPERWKEYVIYAESFDPALQQSQLYIDFLKNLKDLNLSVPTPEGRQLLLQVIGD